MTVLCRFLSILAATNWLLASLLWLQSSPSVEADLPSDKETFQRERTFSLSQLSGECQFYPDFSLFLKLSFVLPSYMDIFLPFQKPEVFCQYAVDNL